MFFFICITANSFPVRLFEKRRKKRTSAVCMHSHWQKHFGRSFVVLVLSPEDPVDDVCATRSFYPMSLHCTKHNCQAVTFAGKMTGRGRCIHSPSVMVKTKFLISQRYLVACCMLTVWTSKYVAVLWNLWLSAFMFFLLQLLCFLFFFPLSSWLQSLLFLLKRTSSSSTREVSEMRFRTNCCAEQ